MLPLLSFAALCVGALTAQNRPFGLGDPFPRIRTPGAAGTCTLGQIIVQPNQLDRRLFDGLDFGERSFQKAGTELLFLSGSRTVQRYPIETIDYLRQVFFIRSLIRQPS